MLINFEKKLQSKRDELLARVQRIEGSIDQAVARDWHERENEFEQRKVLQGLQNEGYHELRKIDFALERIKKGQFGFCVECDVKIAAERLEAVPHAIKCGACARAE